MTPIHQQPLPFCVPGRHPIRLTQERKMIRARFLRPDEVWVTASDSPAQVLCCSDHYPAVR